MERKLLITIYSHFFKLTRVPLKFHPLLQRLIKKNCTFNWKKTPDGRAVLEPLHYFGIMDYRSDYRFHIGQLPFLYQIFTHFGISENEYEVERYDLFPGADVDIKFNSDFTLRDFQPDAEKFILNDDEDDNHTRLISVYTGGGKSVIASSAISKIGKRTLIPVLPKYVDKWIEDVQKYTNIRPIEIAVINGGDKLAGIIDMGLNDRLKGIKVIIISLVTLRNSYKEYYSDCMAYEAKYGIQPEELCKALGCGLILTDEAHEHLYSIYQLLCHTHVTKAIMLSATMTSGDNQILEVQDFMFPKLKRYTGANMKKYIKTFATSFRFRRYDQGNIRTKAYNSNLYSHIEFEKSILRYKQLKEAYLDMIVYYIEEHYLSNYQKGDRCMIFAASVDMCTVIVDRLTKIFRTRFDIRRYAPSAGDSYENVIVPDIRVTTAISGGTGVDIKNLTTCIATNTILAPVPNHQMFGRLREINDREVRYCYLYCEQIPKQVEGHRIKKDLFKHKSGSIIDTRYPKELDFDPRIKR